MSCERTTSTGWSIQKRAANVATGVLKPESTKKSSEADAISRTSTQYVLTARDSSSGHQQARYGKEPLPAVSSRASSRMRLGKSAPLTRRRLEELTHHFSFRLMSKVIN